MNKTRKINVNKTEISVIIKDETDYISLTDMTKGFDEGSGLIGKWITNKNTLEYLGTWERISNPVFNYPEFGVIENNAGVNRFTMSAGQWIERTAAVGILVKAGRYGGTYAHRDIAFHFAMWLSPEFQIYLVKEFQRLQETEQKQLGWDVKRNLTKINYRIHTDAIRAHLIPPELSGKQTSLIYASEADVLNMALFGRTAKDWRDANPNEKGNIRDQANASQLVCLANLENLNALFINEGLPQPLRLHKLNRIAIEQMEILTSEYSRRLLGEGETK